MQALGPLVVVGAFGIDTNVYSVGGRLGAETTFSHVTDGLGQAGCYSALAAVALDVPTRAIAAIGDDRAGAWVRDESIRAGFGLTELRDPAGTHRSVNLVAGDGSRRNYFDARGAGEVIVDESACRAALSGAGIVHVHLDDWARHVLPLAREAGAIISCDLQDAVEVDDPYRADFVAAADIIFVSAANLADPPAAALELASRHPGRVVVVGAGEAGCLVAVDGALTRYEAVQLEGRPVVDTNGAGDNLAIGFLVARHVDGVSLDQAISRAQLGARWICSQRGDEKQPVTRADLASLMSVATQAGRRP